MEKSKIGAKTERHHTQKRSQKKMMKKEEEKRKRGEERNKERRRSKGGSKGVEDVKEGRRGDGFCETVIDLTRAEVFGGSGKSDNTMTMISGPSRLQILQKLRQSRRIAKTLQILL